MNSPKTLPWLSATAGIPLDRATQLWTLASDSASKITGESESARYLGMAQNQMIALVEKELLNANPISDAPWLMIQAHLSVLPLVLANTFVQGAAALRYALCRQLGTDAKKCS